MHEQPMLIAYPVLREIMPVDSENDPLYDELIRYTIMIYDPKSALVIAERDLNYRKGVAAELCGLPVDDEEHMEHIYSCARVGLVELTCKFLVRFVKSKEWAAICAYEYKFWEAIRLIMQPIAADKSDREQLDAANKKDVLSASIDEGLVKLDTYYKSFFGEDTELERRAKKRMTPELMAKKEA
jgi:hypothetical protein